MSQDNILVLIFGGLVAAGGFGVLIRGYFSLRKMRRELESGHSL